MSEDRAKPKSISEVRRRLAEGRFEFSRHAFRRAVERNISEVEIMAAGAEAEVIEEYPEDKYSPSALLLGYTRTGRPLHLQVALGASEMVYIVTIYEPDPARWVEFRQRRQP